MSPTARCDDASAPDPASEPEREGRLAVLHTALNARIYALGIRARLLKRKVTDNRAIQEYLERHSVRSVQLGTGPNPIAGWLNTDVSPDDYAQLRDKIVFLDAAKRFPFDDMSIDYIFSEHQVEHISEMQALNMLQESFRVLRPGGRIRIATPDLSAIVRLQTDDLDNLARHYLDFMMTRFMADIRSGNPSCHVINHMFYAHGHKFIYDFDTLSARLAATGFVEVVRYRPGESGDPALRGLEAHGRAVGDEDVNRFETMVLEAARPLS